MRLANAINDVLLREQFPVPLDWKEAALTQQYDPGASWTDAMADAHNDGLMLHDEHDSVTELLADAGINHETSVSAAIGNACMISVGHAMADYNSPDE